MELLRPLAGYTLYDHKTNDYIRRDTRHDRWIQTELAFTLAKNATKPNTFDIIPLQTTRKENNWKTEEALVRAAVTVETERIKGSNPWCLWWWSWWWWCFMLLKTRRLKSLIILFIIKLSKTIMLLRISGSPVCSLYIQSVVLMAFINECAIVIINGTNLIF